MLAVEVVYVRPRSAEVVALEVPPGTSVAEAALHSGLPERFGIDLSQCAVGVFGNTCEPATPVRAGDRVEIYRALKMDPKDRRRRLISSG